LRFDERYALALKEESGPQLGRRQVIVDLGEPPNMIESCRAHKAVSVHIGHCAEPALEGDKKHVISSLPPIPGVFIYCHIT
jgi:hypothetical protein